MNPLEGYLVGRLSGRRAGLRQPHRHSRLTGAGRSRRQAVFVFQRGDWGHDAAAALRKLPPSIASICSRA